MSGFDLVPVEGGDPVRLPPGETVLGRGPFLGVSDKRVSRHHALLENLDGQLRLKPTHVNPCFVQTTPAGEPRPLQRGSWHPLRHGDLFSLLPGQLLYEVVAADGESDGGGGGTPRNSQMFEEEELRVEPPPPPPPIGREPAAAVSQQDEKDRTRPVEAEPDRSAAAPPPPSTPRRRVLPAWMMAAVTAPNAPPSCSRRVQSGVKGGKRAPAKKAEISEEEEEEEDTPKKRSRKTCDGGEAKTDVPRERPAVRLQRGSVRPEVSDESDGFVAEEGGGTAPADAVATTRGEAGKSTDGRQTAGRAESVGSNSSRASGPAPSTRGRTPCPYGRDCYRKNPVHFQECSHPGDTDYEDEDEDEDEEEADRPECPYGTDCYRKNPLHRREYKHTKKPAYNTRTAPTKTPGADEDLSDDDSFIDDDSVEAGDDSDYVPPDSDSGKEDIGELQKEARAFLKKRK